ncbi:hypothetical protein [Paraherbaspirillum soli]|uniref:Uncharacterized protein n=1 Tax=Paraherbaspirillum soli TaxID=631222 RepID=A0ABW0MH81_9BURK
MNVKVGNGTSLNEVSGGRWRMRSWLLSFVLISSNSLACFTMPPNAGRPHNALVREASSIVLLQAIAPTTVREECQFKVVRTLKGRTPEDLRITCRLPKAGDWMTNFSGHSEGNFWKGSGRLGINGDCSVIPPAFTPGKTYLVLFGIAPDTKQYEEIGGSDDIWLKYVLDQIASGD